ncbi:sugar phosphate isomerase/epimerase [Bremerella cremea]|uniref:Xylose isomerase n=1 Tax=Blastopirellula marina TaxID=124 RepID=A0A2S8FKT5_9BACT|nr:MULTISPECIES: sugar phosphate isomerase/epimerase [Pirellulaceae]PQO32795.1 xylose isomerase [Blastopirellula marina]RCS45862.1 sugar phosphate isomerase/epimerase [Bremerella cremea]
MTLSRRRFLATTSAAVAACALPGRAWATYDQSRFPGFKVGLQSYSLRGFDVDKAIKVAGELGSAHLEFFSGHFPLNASDEQIAAMKKKMSDQGMVILGHGVNGFSKNHEANEKVFKFAKAAGIKNISADPSPDSFDSLDKLVDKYDIRIAIHNHGPSHRYNTALDVLNAVKAHDPRIGACADLGHFIRSGEDPVEVIRLLKGRLFGIHLKDFAEQKERTKGVILGKGHLDTVGVFRALRQVEFPADGCLSLEYEENPQDPVADIHECLEIASDACKTAAS